VCSIYFICSFDMHNNIVLTMYWRVLIPCSCDDGVNNKDKLQDGLFWRESHQVRFLTRRVVVVAKHPMADPQNSA
jgi:hypothetical protein